MTNHINVCIDFCFPFELEKSILDWLFVEPLVEVFGSVNKMKTMITIEAKIQIFSIIVITSMANVCNYLNNVILILLTLNF
jgi:hypothetical protein